MGSKSRVKEPGTFITKKKQVQYQHNGNLTFCDRPQYSQHSQISRPPKIMRAVTIELVPPVQTCEGGKPFSPNKIVEDIANRISSKRVKDKLREENKEILDPQAENRVKPNVELNQATRVLVASNKQYSLTSLIYSVCFFITICYFYLIFSIIMFRSSDITINAEEVNRWCSFGVMVFLIILVIIFWCKWRHDSIPILQVLNILIINEIFYAASEGIGYFDKTDNILCSISMIGRMAFIVAANFWIIFITRLIYLESSAPGKYFNFVRFVVKNVVFTYIPSLILSIFLLVVINISNTQSEKICWQIITNKQTFDQIIFGTTFILPNFVTIVVLVVYLFLLCQLPSKKWTFFLLFSMTSLLFSIYYVTIKLYQLIQQQSDIGYFNLVMILQPIIYGVLFIMVYWKQKTKSIYTSDLTIRSSEGEVSFIQQV